LLPWTRTHWWCSTKCLQGKSDAPLSLGNFKQTEMHVMRHRFVLTCRTT
jgi:hypothetical protein